MAKKDSSNADEKKYSGSDFRDDVVKYINGWNANIEVLIEVNVGSRFVGTSRRLDIVVHNKDNNKYVGIECKYQNSNGTTYEKLTYALEDCIASPIPTIIAFAGSEIKTDMKSKLIMSGYGIELFIDQNGRLIDGDNLFRQRCYIELGLDWFPFATGQKIAEQLKKLGQ